LLLLGGRLSDLFGAKRVFALGWGVLAVGSFGAGVADSVGLEIASRSVQGAGAALIAPSALTLLMMLFGSNPKELTKAFAIYGAAAPAGGTAGVFLGGVITESWNGGARRRRCYRSRAACSCSAPSSPSTPRGARR
jgi:MFS family permease